MHFRDLGETEQCSGLVIIDYVITGDRILDSFIYHPLLSVQGCFVEYTLIISLNSLKQTR